MHMQEVTTALLEHHPESEVATLKGHRRYAIKGQVFPAIIVGDDDDEVHGVVSMPCQPSQLMQLHTHAYAALKLPHR